MSAEIMNVATWEEIIRLDRRVIELESRFRHRHVASGIAGNETCRHCGLDLRDPIHSRIEEES